MLTTALLLLAPTPLPQSTLAGSGLPVSVTESQRLRAADGALADHLGRSVALHGDWLFAGADFDAEPLYKSGAVFAFERTAAGWVERQKLVPADPSYEKRFGFSLAFDGETLVVGAIGDAPAGGGDWGAAYVFTHQGGAWVEQAKLLPSDPEQRDAFGWAVDVEGDTVLIGTPHLDCTPDPGAVYAFARQAGAWSEVQKVVPADGVPCGDFGSSLDLDGDRVVIGCEGDNEAGQPFAGAAYVYARQGGSWSWEAKLLAPDGMPHDTFGCAVALSGDVLAATSFPNADPQLGGAAYVFERGAGAWSLMEKVRASDGFDGDLFGIAVRLDGPRLVVGALDADAAQVETGAAYAFLRHDAHWQETTKLVAGDGETWDDFGVGVALDAQRVVVSAQKAQPLSEGMVYVYELPAAVGTGYCAGDGSGAACPCGNESPPDAGEGCLNSTGAGAFLLLGGLAELDEDGLHAVAAQAPPGRSVMLIGATASVADGAGAPFGDGLACVGGTLRKLGFRSTSPAGSAGWGPGLVAAGGWQAGETAYLQAWCRDSAGSPCGTGFNTTNAVAAVVR